jgi:hypothetical protein
VSDSKISMVAGKNLEHKSTLCRSHYCCNFPSSWKLKWFPQLLWK